MSSFDWDEFNKLIAKPPKKLVEQLARKFEKARGSDDWASALPGEHAELIAYLENLLPSDDWYGGKPVRECIAIDRIVDSLFLEFPPKSMKVRSLTGDVLFEVLMLTSQFEKSEENDRPKRCLSVSDPGTNAVRLASDDVSELAAFGSRPFRHRSWSAESMAAELKTKNPFFDGFDSVYIPDYSIHSPSQVQELRQDLARVHEGVRQVLENTKSANRPKGALFQNFELSLVAPIERAVRTGVAVLARKDY